MELASSLAGVFAHPLVLLQGAPVDAQGCVERGGWW
jgi:hypothetical protein